MDLGLKGKTALVAAASQGLGFAVARELAAEGCSLIICSRKQESIDRAAMSIRAETNAEVLSLAADVSITSEIEKLVAAGLERFADIDILVTNSGGPPAGPFESTTRESWDDAVRILLNSVIDLSRLVLPRMKDRGWGRILNVTSIASKQPVDNLILSNSLRAGVTGFAKTLAAEVAPFGITVNNILPGYTRTERLDELIDFLSNKEDISADEVRGRWEKEIPMRRLGDPKEFAALAAFLVSERASYITGSSIAVDGGWIRSLF
ncbi:MAG: SDR family oxidoreductase [Acidobacteria bacterium]|nr:SDR family oxidoreductase [Acidobacteriota bacterium]